MARSGPAESAQFVDEGCGRRDRPRPGPHPRGARQSHLRGHRPDARASAPRVAVRVARTQSPTAPQHPASAPQRELPKLYINPNPRETSPVCRWQYFIKRSAKKAYYKRPAGPPGRSTSTCPPPTQRAQPVRGLAGWITLSGPLDENRLKAAQRHPRTTRGPLVFTAGSVQIRRSTG